MLTHEKINLPEEIFEALKGKVFKTRTVRQVTFTEGIAQAFNYHPTTGKRIAPFTRVQVKARLLAPVTRTLGEYGLNAIHSLIHDQDFAYQGQAETGEYLFFKDEVNFTLNGQSYHIPSAMKVLTVDGSGATLETVSDPTQYTFKGKTYTAEQVAAMCGLTEAQFNLEVYDRWDANSFDQSTHITSTFAIVRETNGGYITDLYVNEVETDPTTYSQKFTHYGKKTSVKLNYVIYNDCTPATAETSAGFEAGNFGTCAVIKNHAWNTPIDFAFDLERKYAILEARVCEQPETGKEYRTSGYFDMKTNQPIPRLHRETGEGVVFI
jgi:hypothetical protein